MSLTCGQCKSSKIFPDPREGNLVCVECGLVASTIIFDETAELQLARKDGDAYTATRLGPALDPTDPFESIGTLIGCSYVKFGLEKWALRTSSNSFFSVFQQAKSYLEAISTEFRLPPLVVRHTEKLLKKVYREKLSPRCPQIVLAISCLLTTCMSNKVKLDFLALLHWLELPVAVVLKVFLKLSTSFEYLTALAIMEFTTLALCSVLKLPPRIQSSCLHFCRSLPTLESPPGLTAASVLYLVTRHSRHNSFLSPSVLSKLVSVGSRELRATYEKLQPHSFRILSSQFRL